MSWTGSAPEAGDIRDLRALGYRVSAGRSLGAGERTYGKEKVYPPMDARLQIPGRSYRLHLAAPVTSLHPVGRQQCMQTLSTSAVYPSRATSPCQSSPFGPPRSWPRRSGAPWGGRSAGKVAEQGQTTGSTSARCIAAFCGDRGDAREVWMGLGNQLRPVSVRKPHACYAIRACCRHRLPALTLFHRR